MVGAMNEAEARGRERLWRGRVKSWEASGQSAPRFAEGKDFSASALLYWRRRLRGTSSAPTAGPCFAQVVPRGSAPVAAGSDGGIVVEVAGVSIRVDRGFDAGLLGEVVRALREGIR